MLFIRMQATVLIGRNVADIVFFFREDIRRGQLCIGCREACAFSGALIRLGADGILTEVHVYG